MRRKATLIIGASLLFGCSDTESAVSTVPAENIRPSLGDACTRNDVRYACTDESNPAYCKCDVSRAPETDCDGNWTWESLDNGCHCEGDFIVCPGLGEPCGEAEQWNHACVDPGSTDSVRCTYGTWVEGIDSGGSGCDCNDFRLDCWDAGFVGIFKAGSRARRRARRA